MIGIYLFIILMACWGAQDLLKYKISWFALIVGYCTGKIIIEIIMKISQSISNF